LVVCEQRKKKRREVKEEAKTELKKNPTSFSMDPEPKARVPDPAELMRSSPRLKPQARLASGLQDIGLLKIPSFSNQHDFQGNANYFEKQPSFRNISHMFYSRNNLGAFNKVNHNEQPELVLQPPRPAKQSSIINLRNLPKPTDSSNSFSLMFNQDLPDRPTTRSSTLDRQTKPKATESLKFM
jgi:hypothetical protein